MSKLHSNNIHSGSYDLELLSKALPELKEFIIGKEGGGETLDFSNPRAVLLLNKALLTQYYNVDFWNIPEGYLCPAVPGRADHIHYAADLLAELNGGEVPRGRKVQVLDVGTGASCIYPIIGCGTFGWKFTATEIDPLSLKTARLIVQSNPALGKLVRIRQQKQKQFILRNMIEEKEQFDLTICNPPFHGSKKEAAEANREKWRKLKGAGEMTNLNFGGMENELWYPGGESAFIGRMIRESGDFKNRVCWFTSLVSRSENLKALEKALGESDCRDYRVIPMAQGQKQSRLLAWTYLSTGERDKWSEKYR